jgi:phage/plasmid-like protein (TIGR03299 family)
MSHEFESGYFVGKPAWHQLGTVLKKPPTAEQAIVQAGLDWRVTEEPFYQLETEQSEARLCKRLVRDIDQKVLSTVNHAYTPLQNQDAFRWFDPLLETGNLELESAGSLQGGKRIWILAKIKYSEVAINRKDWVRPYLLLHNSHDGSTAVWIQFTPVRVVCMNTLAGAAFNRFGDLWQKKSICIPHTFTLQEQMSKMQTLIDLTKREFNASLEEYKEMASHEINNELLATYMGNVLGTARPLLHPEWSQLVHNFEQGQGNQGKTLWDAYNAVTEWIDHQSKASAEDRLSYSWFSSGFRLRTKAHRMALSMIRNQMGEGRSIRKKYCQLLT